MDLAQDEVKVVVLGIHGVGDTKSDYVRKSVAANLRAGGIDVEVAEYWWNERVQKPLAEGKLRLEALQGIVSNLISAGTLGFRRKSDEHSVLGSFLNYGFEWSHLLISLGVTSFVFLPLLTMTLLLPFNTWLDTSLFQFDWIWPVAIGLILSGCFLLLMSTFLSLFSFNRATISQSIRRAVFIFLAPLISILCSPFLIPWKKGFKQLWWLVGISLMILIAFASEGGGEHVPYVLTWSLIAIATSALALFLLGTLTQFVIGPVIKILLDIFYYVGDLEYRSRLQEGLRELITQSRERYGSDVHYVVLAHSLGSVISVDSLVNFECWEGTRQVTLITMGSPLRRLFVRFFPGVLFPASLDLTYEAISKRVAHFRWINIYRPWDQIGTSFGAKSAGGIVEVSTGQWTRILSAHVDYWSDPLVRDKVLEEMNRPQMDALPKPAPNVHVQEAWPDYTPSPYFSPVYLKMPGWLLSAMAVVVITLSLALTIAARVAMNRQLDRNLAALASSGKEGQAQVKLSVQYIPGGQGQAPSTNYTFTLFYGHDREHIEQVSLNDMHSTRRLAFDWRKLADDIMEKGQRIRTRGLPAGESEYTPSGIAIRYLPSDARVFDLPAYPATGSLFFDGFSVISTIFRLIICLILVFGVGAFLLAGFLGFPLELSEAVGNEGE